MYVAFMNLEKGQDKVCSEEKWMMRMNMELLVT